MKRKINPFNKTNLHFLFVFLIIFGFALLSLIFYQFDNQESINETKIGVLNMDSNEVTTINTQSFPGRPGNPWDNRTDGGKPPRDGDPPPPTGEDPPSDGVILTGISVSPELILVVIGIFTVVSLIGYYAKVRRDETNLRVVNQLGKRRLLPKEGSEVYGTWGYDSNKGIPKWAYKIILRRKSASGKITYKHLPKKLKKKQVIYCNYWKVKDRHYNLQAYKLSRDEFIDGKNALEDIHSKIKYKHLIKNNPTSNKVKEFKMQMEEEEQITHGDREIDLIKQLLDAKL